MKSEFIRMSQVVSVSAKARYDGRIYHPSKQEKWSASWIASYKQARQKSVDRMHRSLERIRRTSLHEVPVDMSIDIARAIQTMKRSPLRQDYMMQFFARFIRHEFVGTQRWQLEKAKSSMVRSVQQGFLDEMLRSRVYAEQKNDSPLGKKLASVHPNDMVRFWKDTGYTGAARLGVTLK